MSRSFRWPNYAIWRWRRNALPLLVWLIAAGIASWLLAHRSSANELTGIAQADQRDVAALTNGRLQLVPVEMFDSVKQGQPVAVLEDDRIAASLATAAAEVSRLRAELAATEDRLAIDAAVQHSDHMAEARRYAVDVERNRLHEIELQVMMETDRIKAEFLRLQKDLLGNLRGQRAVSELRFRSAEADYKALEKNLGENQKALAQVRQDLEQARQRQDSFSGNQVEYLAIDKALEPLRAAVTVQERRLAELCVDRSMLVLKSPMDGVVSQLLRRAGESVRTGEQIMTIVSTRPSAVIAYATAAQVVQFQPGLPVRLDVIREGIARHSACTRVQLIGPVAEKLPAQLWRNPTTPEWGWPVKIAIPPQLGILCGEVIGIARP